MKTHPNSTEHGLNKVRLLKQFVVLDVAGFSLFFPTLGGEVILFSGVLELNWVKITARLNA